MHTNYTYIFYMVILNYFEVKQKMRVYIVTKNMHIMQIFNMHVYVCIYIYTCT